VLFSVDPKLSEALDSQSLPLLIFSSTSIIFTLALFLLLTWVRDVGALNFKPFFNPPVVRVRDALSTFLAAHEARNFVKGEGLPWALSNSGFDILWEDINWDKVCPVALSICIILFPFLVVIAALDSALLAALMLDVARTMANFLRSLIFRALSGRCDMVVELVKKIEAT
jgi:hypothetical protein